jgi:hypothetical protein
LVAGPAFASPQSAGKTALAVAALTCEKRSKH